jgi:polyhydroxyalkanoate synthesis regulator phasin
MGISIDGQITNLGKLYDAMVKTGLANLSARDAEFRFGDAIQKASGQADELKAKLKGDLSSALDKTGKDFNKTTAAGQEAEAAFSSVTQAGLQNASVMAHDVTKGNAEVQGALKGTYDNMIKTAEKFGLGSTAAEDLTRSVLGIPKGVSINSWMADTAKRMAEQTRNAMDKIDGKTVNTYINHHETTFLNEVRSESIQQSQGTSHDGSKHGFWTGGKIPGLAGGGTYSGLVPGRSPQNPRMDNILALVNGKPLGLRSGEYVVNEPQTKANMPWLKAMNAGLKMSDLFADHTPKLAYAASPGVGNRTTNITNNNNARTVTNQVTINSTADARSLAAEFSRMTANM